MIFLDKSNFTGDTIINADKLYHGFTLQSLILLFQRTIIFGLGVFYEKIYGYVACRYFTCGIFSRFCERRK